MKLKELRMNIKQLDLEEKKKMKKTMLTYRTLDRFERDYKTEHYTEEQIAKIELAAYVANMNTVTHPEWNERNIFEDFLRVLKIDKIDLMKKHSM